ncbi:DNA-3-methyladenine glycosylase [Halocola ammonii]
MPEKLPRSFYQREDVVQIARDLLGKQLVTEIGGVRTSAKIVETEAYKGSTDRACHAFNYRKTKRTAVMFEPGGVAYVYLCYGIHHLFNIITNIEGEPDAVLIRAAEPLEGIEEMLARREMTELKARLTAGPGSLSKALGIRKEQTGVDLTDDQIWLEDYGETISSELIIASPRVGIDYAGEDAKLPWRFRVKENKWVSPAK